MPISEVPKFVSSLRDMMCAIENIRIPTIAAIDGSALGGGLEMALSCDIRIGGPDALMGLPETKLGIFPGAGGTQRLSRLVGTSKAKELMFLGSIVDSKEAFRLSLLNFQASDSAAVLAESLAEKISRNGPLAIRACKSAINMGIDSNM